MDEEKGGGDGGWNGVEGLGRRGATPKRRRLVLAMPARPSLESLESSSSHIGHVAGMAPGLHLRP